MQLRFFLNHILLFSALRLQQDYVYFVGLHNAPNTSRRWLPVVLVGKHVLCFGKNLCLEGYGGLEPQQNLPKLDHLLSLQRYFKNKGSLESLGKLGFAKVNNKSSLDRPSDLV